MIEKGLSGGIFHAIHRYGKAINKYKSDYDKNKESLYLNCWNVKKRIWKENVDGFKCFENTSQFVKKNHRKLK